jgi:ABC-type nitrate/sulfonate/bicarbonate transport system substrate-binding protein
MTKALYVCVAAALLLAFASGSAIATDAEINAQNLTVLRYFADHDQIYPYQFAAALGYLKSNGIEIKSVGFAAGGPERSYTYRDAQFWIDTLDKASKLKAG